MNLLYLDNNISDIIFNNNYVNQNLLSLVNKEINSIVKIKIIKFNKIRMYTYFNYKYLCLILLIMFLYLTV